MPIRNALLEEIRSALGNGLAPTLTSSSAVSDIFEAYVFALVIEAAVAEGAHVSFTDVHGHIASNFHFRTSPGRIHSQSHPYGHAVVAFPNKPRLEAHLGVRVVGRSGVEHECDVSVVQQAEARRCRVENRSPRYNKVLLAVECKFYTTTPELHLGRSFLGLDSDLSSVNCCFVVNCSSSSIERLLSHHKKEWEHHVVPTSREADRLRHIFQASFKHFKARG